MTYSEAQKHHKNYTISYKNCLPHRALRQKPGYLQKQPCHLPEETGVWLQPMLACCQLCHRPRDGAYTWTLTKQAQNKLAAAHTKMERSMVNITYKDRKTNTCRSSLGADWVSDSTIAITHSLLRWIHFSQCRWCLAGCSCMYGLSDKCPASVDKFSSRLEIISSLDFDSERVHDAGALLQFSRHHPV